MRSSAGVAGGYVVGASECCVSAWPGRAVDDRRAGQRAHLTRSRLVRAFDATVGMSPMAYLRQMRVERMARLLTSTASRLRTTAVSNPPRR